MYVQPMLLRALTGWPGIGAGFEVRGAPSGRADRAADDGAGAAGSTRNDSPRSDLRDTLEISQQAEAQLLGPLSEAAQREVQGLRTRDRKVRAHEQAHLAAAGAYAQGGASFEYATGPDGRQYAVGGEVSIDASPVQGDPEATIQKAQVIRAAAMAPADPSAQDRRGNQDGSRGPAGTPQAAASRSLPGRRLRGVRGHPLRRGRLEENWGQSALSH